MNNTTKNRSAGNTYYDRNNERLKKYPRNHYHQEDGNKKGKKYYENNKGQKNKLETNIDNYLIKKKI